MVNKIIQRDNELENCTVNVRMDHPVVTVVQKRRSLDGCVPFSLPCARIYLQPRSICRTTPIDVSPCSRRWCNSINDAKWRSRHRRHKSGTRPAIDQGIRVFPAKMPLRESASRNFHRSSHRFFKRSITVTQHSGPGLRVNFFTSLKSQRRARFSSRSEIESRNPRFLSTCN